MKNKIWLLQIPFVIIFTLAFYITESGVQGELTNPILRTKIYPFLQTINGWVTNAKFHARGPKPPKNKVVIVEIDSDSIAQFGRWPWHRDLTGYLVQKTFEAGAKVVGLDMVFSEPDQRVSNELAELLNQNKLGDKVKDFETDLVLQQVIALNQSKLVTGWTTETWCQPAYNSPEDCQILDPERLATHPKNFEKFAYTKIVTEAGFDQATTPLLATPDFLANIDIYNDAAAHSGYFTAWPDNDSYIRRTNLLITANGRAYPSLPLEMARVGMNEDLQVTLDRNNKVKNIGFMKSGRNIEVSPLGVMEINFRGPSYTFQYVKAMEVMSDADDIRVVDQVQRKIASASKTDLLKDAYVLIGLSAVGVFDMRAFPFDSNTPGVEGHANILDNLISGDTLVHGSGKSSSAWLFLIMTVGALLFAYVTQRLESIPALLLFLFVGSGFTLFDLKVLFENNVNWNTSLLYIEVIIIFMFTLAIKYVLEERNKKFIRGAFAKYVAPAIVDSILKDPSKLSVGGEKKDLTILFSDIRGFTTFSERLDARALAKFLNDYLGIMTDIVFDNEGTLDKYIGDAVMAFWGAPLDQPNHARNACTAAIKMMNALGQHRERFKTQYGVEVNIGIGINSGAVNVGNMGSERIFEYTVIGDHVNLASRLEGLTKAYSASIVTTRFTFDFIQQAGGQLPGHRTLDMVKVKGKKNAVELIQVLENTPSPEALALFQEARGLYTKQNWDKAIEAFDAANKALQLGPDRQDGPSLIYIDRCKEFKQSPPSADWDGSWEMHSK